MSTPVILRTVVGHCAEVTAWWGEPGSCRPNMGHVARLDLGPATALPDLGDPANRGWEGACSSCGASPIPWDHPGTMRRCDDPECADCPYEKPYVGLGGSLRAVYDTADGRLHPGDAYWLEHPVGRWCRWTNCDGRHLHVMLPNGHEWDVMSRANNCTLPDDTTHRCWQLTGEPGTWTAGKTQPTCSAGAGSILSGDYHGFLQGGVLT